MIIVIDRSAVSCPDSSQVWKC